MYHYRFPSHFEEKIKDQRGHFLLIYLLQCCVPTAFRIQLDLDLPRPATNWTIFYIGLAASPALIDVQFYGLTAVGADELNEFHLILRAI
jgi:hypothetical protein